MEARNSFEDFFRDEYASIVRTLVPIVGAVADAEAVAQDAFVKAMERWRRVRDYDRPGAWVRRVAIRDAVRHASRQRRSPSVDLAPATPADDVAGRLDLHAALATLTARQRAAIVLHHLAGWPVAEVADALGCAEATVRVHLHRGRTALAVALRDEPDEVPDAH
jgi:RNA polymerase sigma-70 factor (ECF subfamily)